MNGTLSKKAVELDPIHCKRHGLENVADRERTRWAELTNAALERAGEKAQVDHRSLEAQGIERRPTVHLGPNVIRMERRGLRTDRGDVSREIEEQNGRLAAFTAQIIDLAEARKRIEHERELAGQREEARKELQGVPAERPGPVKEEQRSVQQESQKSLDALEVLWAAEKGKLLPAIKAKAARIQARAEGLLDLHRSRQSEHEKNRPRKATGIFTAYRAIGYEKRFETWEKTKKQLDKRYWQLRERMGLVEEYQVDTTIPQYPSKAEKLAERILRKSYPQLAQKLDQARARELERRKEEIERKIKKDRQRERDRDRGFRR